jgi:CRISPR type IV-associated protein Csf3
MTATLVPMRVRAVLASGIAQAAPWGIALDGLLAAEMWADRKAAASATGQTVPGLLDCGDPEDLALPLGRCTAPDGLWHWTATCALPEGRPQSVPIEIRYWSGRVDHRPLEQLTSALPAVLSDRQGRYRARRMPLLVTPCTAVSWRAVGDPDAVRAALDRITAIGKKRSHGEGHVLAWEVAPEPDLDPWAAAHLHPDGTLGRPTPPECLAGHGPVVDGGRGAAGLRPPYMHPARRHILRLPALLDS